MKEITLTQRKIALVDDCDYEWLSQRNWAAFKDRNIWYAMTNIRDATGHFRSITMHRLILGATKGMKVDHRDGNGLNNQRHNLRAATNHQNLCNRGAPSNNTSGFKGVSWHKRRNKWQANIGINYKKKYLGLFDSAIDAACAYDAAARELHGEFAKLNFPR